MYFVISLILMSFSKFNTIFLLMALLSLILNKFEPFLEIVWYA